MNSPRTILLKQWDQATKELQEATSKPAIYKAAGKLETLSTTLQQCRNNGDGTNPIQADEWPNEALRLISKKLKVNT